MKIKQIISTKICKQSDVSDTRSAGDLPVYRAHSIHRDAAVSTG